MKKVFKVYLSYTTELEDHTLAIRKLFDGMKEFELELLLDEYQSTVSSVHGLRKRIQSAIKESDIFICVFPINANKRYYLYEELEFAISLHKRHTRPVLYSYAYSNDMPGKKYDLHVEKVMDLLDQNSISWHVYEEVDELEELLLTELRRYSGGGKTETIPDNPERKKNLPLVDFSQFDAFKGPKNGNFFVSVDVMRPYWTGQSESLPEKIFIWALYDENEQVLRLHKKSPATRNWESPDELILSQEIGGFYELDATRFSIPSNANGYKVEVELDFQEGSEKNDVLSYEATMPDYFIGGANWSGKDKLPEFLETGSWAHGFEKPIEQVKEVVVGDILFVKTVARRTRELWIRAAGVVIENPEDGIGIKVDWKTDIELLKDGQVVKIADLAGPYSTTFREVRDVDVPIILQAIFGKPRWPFHMARVVAKGTATVSAETDTTRTSGLRLPGTFADSPDGADHLGVEQEVRPFASLIASVKQKPPLSIGLFGDWGSGKSFFMRTLRRQINDLAVLAKRYREFNEEHKAGFHDRIVQIEFNAWHYVDANLWASMVEHIFENLKMEQEDEQTSEERRALLMEKLKSDVALRALRKSRLDELKKTKQEKKERLEAGRLLRNGTAERRQFLEANTIWNLRSLWQVIADSDEFKTQKRDINTQLGRLGNSNAVESVNDVKELTEKIHSSTYRINALAVSIFQGKYWPLRLLTLLIVLVALPLAGRKISAGLSGENTLTDFISGLTAWVGGIVVWVTAAWKRVDHILGKVEKVNNNISARLEEKRTAELSKLSGELDLHEKQVKEAETELYRLDQDIDNLRNEIAGLSPGAELKSFVYNRVSSDDYKKHHGILATVRRDFEKLSELMLNSAKTSEVEVKDDLAEDYRIDRIVLYIDDLDRCPPERVVQVLQAVHLLLAFPLFVVVVGVDSRWVSKSLSLEYKELWTRDEDGENNDRKVSPYDYLEKIFQVPYWIKKMTPDETGDYIGKLLQELEASPPIAIAPNRMSKNYEINETDQLIDENSGDEYSEHLDENNDELPKSSTESPVEEDVTTETQQTGESTVESLQEDFDELEQRANRSNELEAEEITFMQKLAPIINRSPRSTKRFINVYRIIRASHPVMVTDGRLATDDKTVYNYKAIQFLIAILIGQPELSNTFFTHLRNHAKPSEKISTFLNTHTDLVELNTIFQIILSDDDTSTDLELSTLRKYQDMVARYSFRVGDLE